jgi:hypothetical protein
LGYSAAFAAGYGAYSPIFGALGMSALGYLRVPGYGLHDLAFLRSHCKVSLMGLFSVHHLLTPPIVPGWRRIRKFFLPYKGLSLKALLD